MLNNFKIEINTKYKENCDYYVVVCNSECNNRKDITAVAVDDGFASENSVVIWHDIAYVYSSEEVARGRASDLGGTFGILKLKCLKCFLEYFATIFPYFDIYLDETYRIAPLTCRCTANKQLKGYGYDRPRHFEVRTPEDNYFSLQGCAASSNLRWVHVRDNSDPCHPVVHCRPVPYLGRYGVDDTGSPDLISRFYFAGKQYAKMIIDDDICAIFARPIGAVAYSESIDACDIVRIYDDGIWVRCGMLRGNDIGTFEYNENGMIQLCQSSAFVDTKINPTWRLEIYNTDDVVYMHWDRNSEWLMNELFYRAEVLTSGLTVPPQVLNNYEKSLMRHVEKICSTRPLNYSAVIIMEMIEENGFGCLGDIVNADRLLAASTLFTEDDFMKHLDDVVAATVYDRYLLFVIVTFGLSKDAATARRCRELYYKKYPKCSMGLFFNALDRMNEGDTNQEIEFYKQAIAANDANFEAIYNFARTYEEMGKLEDAFELYEKCCRTNPYHTRAIENAACIFWRVGKLENADAVFRVALSSDLHREDTYKNVYEFYSKTNHNKAYAFARQLIELRIPTFVK